ncbi:geranylgeranylglycerol-phosphate geranylgeranyltransferase [Williamwhitmania taraxaci]|uniref:4-hydroxybenzoate polyprenyltransferase n=1 Tax=Williamwhitmania taraxaci TaxID=1640674 RepID=A0A1G6GJ28_9BACT|nr:geranylgeranylglycerol-phosphate geranylgeranyltransferase [Williamwhitmania taraxaci]SDB82017.1 4-hydroxybenzoate polyprenyltransferase [Williamwhitmania taraxaci]
MYRKFRVGAIVPFLGLVRWQNLIIIVITQLAMRYLVMDPILAAMGFSLQLSSMAFAMLVLATVCIAGAGYVINDYFDIKVDAINKPTRPMVIHQVTRRESIALHFILNSIGILAGGYVAYSVHILGLWLIFPLATGLLWFYSTTYKRQLLTGNILVAILTALVPFMVVVFELPLLYADYLPELKELGLNFNVLTYWVGGFSFFAFLLTLIREIVKDMEDFEGDAVVGRNSLPLAFGMKSAKTVVFLLIGMNAIFLIYLFVTKLLYLPTGSVDYLSLGYLSLLVFIPSLWMMWLVFKANSKTDFSKISRLAKLIMLFGILYSLCFFIIVKFEILAS